MARSIAIRDSKDPHGPLLLVSRGEWLSFAARIKRGQAGCLGPLQRAKHARDRAEHEVVVGHQVV